MALQKRLCFGLLALQFCVGVVASADEVPQPIYSPSGVWVVPVVPPAPAAPVVPSTPVVPMAPVAPAELPPPPVFVAPPPAVIPRPAIRPTPVLALRVPDAVALHNASQRRTGIGLVVVGNLLQFAGVSMLVPAVWHGSIAHDSNFQVMPLAVGGSGLVGVGNILEITGWVLYGKSKSASRPAEVRRLPLDDR